jgi:hypothetical protein
MTTLLVLATHYKSSAPHHHFCSNNHAPNGDGSCVVSRDSGVVQRKIGVELGNMGRGLGSAKRSRVENPISAIAYCGRFIRHFECCSPTT